MRSLLAVAACAASAWAEPRAPQVDMAKLVGADACPAPPIPHQVRPPHEADGVWPHMLFFILKKRAAASYWSKYYHDQCVFVEQTLRRTRRLDATRANMTVVEVGTAYGGNSAYMASRFAGAEIYVADPLVPYDANDGTSGEILRFAARNKLESEEVSLGWARALAADQAANVASGCRYHMIRQFSTDAAGLIPGPIDFAFIDGLHTYEGVVADIAAYAPRMAPGGVMIFNDYGSHKHTGVMRAVDEFVARAGLDLVVGAAGVPPGHSNAGVVVPAGGFASSVLSPTDTASTTARVAIVVALLVALLAY